MKINELYIKNEKFVLSFELFPPKTEKGELSLQTELEQLAKFNPGFISVTYGAGGSTREKTLDIALEIHNKFNVTPLAHFTCVGSNRSEIQNYLEIVKSHGINNILALRGDPPVGEKQFERPHDGFGYANELVKFIKSINGFTIAVAGYPEGHIESPDLDTDIVNLKKKVDAGADMIITQLFYDNNDYYKYIDKLCKIGINIPVVPGIMPVTSIAQINKITTMCGAKIPRELTDTLSKCTETQEICKHGIDYTIRQCRELIEWGIKGIHFYPLNKARPVKDIIEALHIT